MTTHAIVNRLWYFCIIYFLSKQYVWSNIMSVINLVTKRVRARIAGKTDLLGTAPQNATEHVLNYLKIISTV